MKRGRYHDRLTLYGSSEISEWVDGGETALCPHCGIDSVLPISEGAPKIGFLLEMHRYWFDHGIRRR
jgi:hypothetical protein